MHKISPTIDPKITLRPGLEPRWPPLSFELPISQFDLSTQLLSISSLAKHLQYPTNDRVGSRQLGLPLQEPQTSIPTFTLLKSISQKDNKNSPQTVRQSALDFDHMITIIKFKFTPLSFWRKHIHTILSQLEVLIGDAIPRNSRIVFILSQNPTWPIAWPPSFSFTINYPNFESSIWSD